jgi:peptide deformylase
MILPILAYGDPILKKKSSEISLNYSGLEELIENMFDTMYEAKGVGLAAPQIGLPIRLFVIDPSPYADEDIQVKKLKKIFINPKIIEVEGEFCLFNEGCLSIPDIREEVERQEKITIQYLNEKGEEIIESYNGIAARVIQHEYDHVEGKLFTDRLSPLRKRMLQSRLDLISKGDIKVDYKMRFPHKKKRKSA